MLGLILGTVMTCTTPWIVIENYGAVQVKNTKATIVAISHPDKVMYYDLKFDVEIPENMRGHKYPAMLGEIGKLHGTSIQKVETEDWIKLNCMANVLQLL